LKLIEADCRDCRYLSRWTDSSSGVNSVSAAVNWTDASSDAFSGARSYLVEQASEQRRSLIIYVCLGCCSLVRCDLPDDLLDCLPDDLPESRTNGSLIATHGSLIAPDGSLIARRRSQRSRRSSSHSALCGRHASSIDGLRRRYSMRRSLSSTRRVRERSSTASSQTRRCADGHSDGH
jgi:hypothetical protein